MARYDREFLVPYLRNVCSVHLAEAKLTNRYNELASKKCKIQQPLNIPTPKEPLYINPVTGGSIICILLGLFFMLGVISAIVVFVVEPDAAPVLMLLLFFGSGGFAYLLLWGAIDSIKERSEKNKEREADYRRKLENIKICQNEWEQAQHLVPRLEEELAICDAEIKRIHTVLLQTYSANVIPRQYRNIYVAVYLYDWFSTSRADNLDSALNMFVLEEIKSKLDEIIENQCEIMLNQQIMIANQEYSNQLQQQYFETMLSKIDRIAKSDEERNQYLSMIESNTAAISYFAGADYIRNITA